MSPADLDPADLAHLEHAVGLAAAARARGDHPFGAVIIAPDGTAIDGLNTVNTAGDPTGHAETNAVRAAAAALAPEALAASVLYTSTEPCAMCTGAIYWAGIGRIVYAFGEDELGALVPDGDPALDLPCRDVLARGGRAVEVVGPVSLPAARSVHEGFWS